MRDSDPRLEDAARRRLAALASALAVPPADPGGLGDPDAVRPVRGRGGGDGSRRWPRRLVLAGLGAAASVAAVTGAVAVLGDEGDGPGTVVVPGDAPGCEAFEPPGDDEVLGGTLPDGTPWALWTEGRGDPPDPVVFGRLDGDDLGGFGLDEDSWPSVVNAGMLPLHVGVGGAGTLISGLVPAEATAVSVLPTSEVGTAGPLARTTCFVPMPGAPDDAVRLFGVALPAGAEPGVVRAEGVDGEALATSVDLSSTILARAPSGGGTSFDVDPARVTLPLGGEELAAPTEPEMVDVVAGDAPGGPWALRVGQDGDEVAVDVAAPGVHLGTQGRLDQLLGPDATWEVDVLDGGALVSGLVAPEVDTVTITREDGTTTTVDAVATLPGLAARAFATFLPGDPTGPSLTAVEARDGGTLVSRAVDVAASLEPLRTDPDLTGIAVLVETVAPTG